MKRPVRDNITFVAAGTGIASLRCMYRQLLLEGHPGNMLLIFGFHAPEDFIYREELEALQKKHPNLKVVTAITTDDATWKGERGRVTEVIPRVIKDAPARDYYLCGSPQMVEDTIKVLLEMGVPRHQIFREVW
jgi:NAD(P)H-flavin reductase